jgi:hypothetical protein
MRVLDYDCIELLSSRVKHVVTAFFSPTFSSLLCRSFHKGDIVSSSRVIVGVDAAIADAASLALMVESVGLGTEQWKDAVKRYPPFPPLPYPPLCLTKTHPTVPSLANITCLDSFS